MAKKPKKPVQTLPTKEEVAAGDGLRGQGELADGSHQTHNESGAQNDCDEPSRCCGKPERPVDTGDQILAGLSQPRTLDNQVAHDPAVDHDGGRLLELRPAELSGLAASACDDLPVVVGQKHGPAHHWTLTAHSRHAAHVRPWPRTHEQRLNTPPANPASIVSREFICQLALGTHAAAEHERSQLKRRRPIRQDGDGR